MIGAGEKKRSHTGPQTSATTADRTRRGARTAASRSQLTHCATGGAGSAIGNATMRHAINCSKETPRRYLVDGRCSNCQLVPCKDCGSPTAKTTLTYGRCTTCLREGRGARPLTAVRRTVASPSSRSTTIEWFKDKGLDDPEVPPGDQEVVPTETTATRPPTPRIPPHGHRHLETHHHTIQDHERGAQEEVLGALPRMAEHLTATRL